VADTWGGGGAGVNNNNANNNNNNNENSNTNGQAMPGSPAKVEGMISSEAALGHSALANAFNAEEQACVRSTCFDIAFIWREGRISQPFLSPAAKHTFATINTTVIHRPPL
jgi:hypothetical protein